MNRIAHSSIALAAAVLCLGLPGCSWVGVRKYWHSNVAEARCDLPSQPTKAEVVEHLNRNIAKSPAWLCTDVKISSRGSGIPLSVHGTIAVQNPRNFRMTADSLAGNEVDMGSNGERLWFWLRQGERAVFTARHEELHRVQLALPFHPDWIIEAFGVVPMDESEVTFQISEGDPNIAFLSRQRKALNGSPVKMVTTVNLYRGVILEHDLRSLNNNELIARAKLSEYKQDPVSGALMPHKVELEWPHDGMSVTLALGKIDVNPATLSAKLFQIPPIEGCPPVDLGRMNFGQRGQVQASPPQRRPVRRRADGNAAPVSDVRPGKARVDLDFDE